MRLNRILYASLLFMAFIFVYFHGGKVPYMLFYTVLALPVVSVLHITAGYWGLKYEQSLDSSSVVKGGKVTLTLRIANRGLLILPYVSIRFLGGDGALIQQPGIKNISIQPFSKQEFCFEHVYKYRGCFELEYPFDSMGCSKRKNYGTQLVGRNGVPRFNRRLDTHLKQRLRPWTPTIQYSSVIPTGGERYQWRYYYIFYGPCFLYRFMLWKTIILLKTGSRYRFRQKGGDDRNI